MRRVRDSIEIIDSGHKSEAVSECYFGSNHIEKIYKSRRTIGYEQTDIHGSWSEDFNKNCYSILKKK